MNQWTKQEILKMTVSDLIDKTSLKVKLGSEGGSGFVYCGYIDEIDVDGLDKAICDSFEATIDKCEITIKNLTNKPKTYRAFVDEMTKKKQYRASKYIKENKEKPLTKDQIEELETEFDTSRKSYMIWVNNLKRRLETARTTKHTTKYKLAHFTTIRSRSIVECYPSFTEEDTTILLFKGSENGKYWTTDEYESGFIDYGEED